MYLKPRWGSHKRKAPLAERKKKKKKRKKIETWNPEDVVEAEESVPLI